MRKMLAIAALAAASLLATEPAQAREYPWCAVFGNGMSGAQNCGFVTFQQCLADISGIGGFCQRNPFYRGEERPARKSRHHYYRD